LHRKKTSDTGDPFIPQDVKEAKRIKIMIAEKLILTQVVKVEMKVMMIMTLMLVM
jgi:hypothetical protein